MRQFYSICLCVFTLALYFVSSTLFVSFGLSPVKASVFTGLLSSSACFYFYSHDKSKTVNKLGFTLGRVVLCLLFFFAFWWVSQNVSAFVYYFTQDASYDSYQTFASGDNILYVILTLFIAPITEELLFRGIWYRELSKTSVWTAYGVSSLLFAFMHGTLVHIPAAVLSGFLFCVVYDYTGKLRYCMLLHILYNLLSLFVPVFYFSDTAYILFVWAFYFIIFGVLLLFALRKHDVDFLKTNKDYAE